MRWLAKAAAQRTFDLLPAGDRLNYLFQRRVTRSVPMDDSSFLMHARSALGHFRALRSHAPEAIPGARLYEFGAGWDLISGVVYWGCGVTAQTLVDIRPNLRLELVNHTLQTYSRLQPQLAEEAGLPLRPAPLLRLDRLSDLAPALGIEYLAPCDARETGLPPDSVDLVSSTFTLEHIPAPDIAAILVEARRILRRGGLISCSIDMMDHYSYFDASLARHHFLRYSDRVWRVLNPSLHYQNRLRAPDYVALFEAAGLEIVQRTVEPAKPAERERLIDMPLAPRFRDYELEDLGARTMTIVARAGLVSA